MCVCLSVYLHGQQCVDAVGEEQFAASCWLPGNPQVQETNTKITLITEDWLLHTHREEEKENKYKNMEKYTIIQYKRQLLQFWAQYLIQR